MLDNLGFAQKQRLAYIDFCLLFKGTIYRQDLINRFEIGFSAGSRDFSIYKELAPDNLKYDAREKRYFQTPAFKPVFGHDARRTLTKLANDISDGFDAIGTQRIFYYWVVDLGAASLEERSGGSTGVSNRTAYCDVAQLGARLWNIT